MSAWKDFITDAAGLLARLETQTLGGVRADPEQAFALWTGWALDAKRAGQTAHFVGCGPCSALASLGAAELARIGRMRAHAYNDAALLTALAEAEGAEAVFTEPLEWSAREGDLVVALGGSGESPAVARALEAARRRGAHSVALSALRPENACRRLADLSFWVPARTAGLSQTCHTAILRHWLDLVAEALAR